MRVYIVTDEFGGELSQIKAFAAIEAARAMARELATECYRADPEEFPSEAVRRDYIARMEGAVAEVEAWDGAMDLCAQYGNDAYVTLAAREV